jgi:rfaE bifunctional protein nucleotidyltransferase chain/domain
MRNEWYILKAMSEKILTVPALAAALSARRTRKERIVFTNGCFDLLHVGHTRYLQEARKLGDCLVVGLNSDASVRAIKSDGRPVVPQAQRAEVLAALACVDHVVIFDEPDPQNLIASIQPDILAKGGDWPIDQIVGREIVQARGGRVVTIPLVPDVSTTSLVRRIKTLP